MFQHERFLKIVETYRQDSESVFHTWFMDGAERLKAFRSIRRGVEQVVDDIRAGTFGNDFRGSSLEFVLNCITEQKQVFVGAAHAFYWKPKLRIPPLGTVWPVRVPRPYATEERLGPVARDHSKPRSQFGL